MIKNYLKVSLRNLWKNKGYSVINIIGLATGLAVFLLIVLYVFDEMNYDRYNEKANRIYRVHADLFFNGTQFRSTNVPEPLALRLKTDYPQIEEMVRFNGQGDMLVRKDNSNIKEHNAVFADSTFFKVFTIPMIEGDPSTALKEPNSIVIDETTAKKYFNSTNVVGKTLYIDNTTTCKITGVFKDIPRQSHFHFSFIRPLVDSYRGNADNWLSNNTLSYVLVRPAITKAELQRLVNVTINKYFVPQFQALTHTSIKDIEQKGSYFNYPVTPVRDIHLHSELSDEFEANGSQTSVYIFSVIAVLILLIACINFINLSTARSANRAKEVGIRKVAGSARGTLIMQFLMESVLLSFFSALVALAITALLMPLFNQLSGKEMQLTTLFSSWLLPVLIGLIFVVGGVAGSYPAFYLSSFQPIQVLKGNIVKGFKASWLRSGLVVFQFCISIVLIIGTIVIYKQLNYIRNKKVGYNREQVLVLHNTYSLGKKIKPFKDELLAIPGVENASITDNLPTATNFNQRGWFRDASFDPVKAMVMTDINVDENYIPTLGMELAQGRNFSKDFATDSSGVILNETAVKLLGLKNPLGEILYRPDYNDKPKAFHIVGIVKDFNFGSLHDKIGPLIAEYAENTGSISLRVNTTNISSIISQTEGKWKSVAPAQPFSYSFMDADFNNIYKSEQQTGRLFITFAVFAIFIACLGLLGLVTYAAEQRTKEIGIRKVLGAGVNSIVAMLSKDFARLVLIAALIAFPFAWWGMNKWLESFAYRISIEWWVFAAAGLGALSIALITVSLQAIKAAIANPIKSLRTE